METDAYFIRFVSYVERQEKESEMLSRRKKIWTPSCLRKGEESEWNQINVNRRKVCGEKKYSSDLSVRWNKFNALVILLLFMLMSEFWTIVATVGGYPIEDCDWMGSGARESEVQAVYLRCNKGQIQWNHPNGGLRVNIEPPQNHLASSESFNLFRLCLQVPLKALYKIFLEKPSTTFQDLMPLVSHTKQSTNCYHIEGTYATLFIEAIGGNSLSRSSFTNASSTIKTNLSILFNNAPNQGENEPLETTKFPEEVNIFYEIDAIDDISLRDNDSTKDYECRPCTEDDVLRSYCTADVVARGEILAVRDSKSEKFLKAIYVRSNLVIHQNHGVFKPIKPGQKNLLQFLGQDVKALEDDQPFRSATSLVANNSNYFGAVVAHPAVCEAHGGPGQFLWLLKLSFAMPKVKCVMYWDTWKQIAKEARAKGSNSCPFIID